MTEHRKGRPGYSAGQLRLELDWNHRIRKRSEYQNLKYDAKGKKGDVESKLNLVKIACQETFETLKFYNSTFEVV